MLPRIIHYIWMQGREQVPPKYRANMDATARLNPGWELRVWTAADTRAAAVALGAGDAYDAASTMHQKVDLGRYCLLYIHGGITMDMDTRALRPLSDLPGLDAIDRLAVSPVPANSLESATVHLHCYRIPASGQTCTLVNNACLLAPPRDPALLHVIRHCAAQTLRHRTAWTNETLINSTTGPQAVTNAVASLPSPGMVAVLPGAYFEPCCGYDPYCTPGPEAIMHHEHDGTWMSSPVRAALPLWYHAKHHWPALLAAALAIWLLRRRA